MPKLTNISPLIGIQSNYRRQVILQTLYSLPKPCKYIPLIVMQSNCRRQVNLQTLYNPCLSLTNISPLIVMQSNCRRQVILQTLYSLSKPYKYIPLMVMQSNCRRQVNLQTLYNPCLSLANISPWLWCRVTTVARLTYKLYTPCQSLTHISPLIGMQSNCRCQVILQTLYSLPKPYKYISLDWDAE